MSQEYYISDCTYAGLILGIPITLQRILLQLRMLITVILCLPIPETNTVD